LKNSFSSLRSSREKRQERLTRSHYWPCEVAPGKKPQNRTERRREKQKETGKPKVFYFGRVEGDVRRRKSLEKKWNRHRKWKASWFLVVGKDYRGINFPQTW